MGHCPRKVFIKENGTYVALSYEAFCKRRQQDPGDWERLFLPIQGCLLETDRETYRAFYRDQERARYLAGVERELGVLSLEEIDLDQEVVHNPFHDPEAELEEASRRRMRRRFPQKTGSTSTPFWSGLFPTSLPPPATGPHPSRH